MDIDFSRLSQETGYLTLKGSKQNHFNNEVVTIQCTVLEVLKFLDIDPTVQRKLDEQKVSSIGKYIQYGLDGNDIYFSPLIFSARGVGKYSEKKKEYTLGLGDHLFILDGQHRIKAFELLQKRMEMYKEDAKTLDALSRFPITIQVFLDIDKKQERQLFTDINTKSSLVNGSILVMYANDDLTAEIVKDIAESLPDDQIETRARSTRSKIMTAATLNLVIKALNEGTYVKDAKTYISEENFNIYKKRTEDFITYIKKYAPKDAYDRDKYIIYGSNILIGIAKFIYEVQKINKEENMEDLFKNVISQVNWKHSNNEFKKINFEFNRNTKKYNLGATGRTVNDLSNFLLKNYNNK